MGTSMKSEQTLEWVYDSARKITIKLARNVHFRMPILSFVTATDVVEFDDESFCRLEIRKLPKLYMLFQNTFVR